MDPIRLHAPADLHGDPSLWWSRLCPYPGNDRWSWKNDWRWRIHFDQNITTGRRHVIRATVWGRDGHCIVEVKFSTRSHFVPKDAFACVTGDDKPYVEFADGKFVGPPAAEALPRGVAAPDDRIEKILAALDVIEHNQSATISLVKGLTNAEKELGTRVRMLRDVLKACEEARLVVQKFPHGAISPDARASFEKAIRRIEVAAEIPF